MVGDRPAVVIYRSRLLARSETFIASQGRALARYRAVFAGYRLAGEGARYLDGAETVTLAANAALPALAKGMLKLTGRVPAGWRRALAAHRPVLLHAHFGFHPRTPVALARSLGVPLIVTYHGADITIERSARRPLAERRLLFAEAARVIAVSRYIAARLTQAGCPEEKIVVHYIGVDTNRFTPEPPTPNPQPPSVLFVGRLVEKKGLIHLIRAMADVAARVPEAELVIAGDGPLRAASEDAARRLGARARFLGAQPPDAVGELMRRASVMCTPFVVAASGDAEGLGMTALEAQASGLPVVAFPSGGSAEAIIHGETGYIAPPKDEAALADGLLTLLEDPALRARFGEAARANVVENFDLARQTRALERIYDAVLAG